MEISVKPYQSLSKDELYAILRIRTEVFVLEQHCVYQDLDGKDDKAFHIIGMEDNMIVAYARCFPPGIYFKESAIGRVLVRENYRKLGYGHKIVDAAIGAIETHFNAKEIRISAQLYLVTFYELHDFKTVGNRYLEENIPHISMIRKV